MLGASWDSPQLRKRFSRIWNQSGRLVRGWVSQRTLSLRKAAIRLRFEILAVLLLIIIAASRFRVANEPSTPQSNSFCIYQLTNEAMEDTMGKHIESVKAYSRLHAYNYIQERTESMQTNTSKAKKGFRYQDKTRMISSFLKRLPENDWMVYIDADAMIMNMSFTMEHAVEKAVQNSPEGSCDVIVQDSLWTINTGFMMVKSNVRARALLDRWYAEHEKNPVNWNGDQGIFMMTAATEIARQKNVMNVPDCTEFPPPAIEAASQFCARKLSLESRRNICSAAEDVRTRTQCIRSMELNLPSCNSTEKMSLSHGRNFCYDYVMTDLLGLPFNRRSSSGLCFLSSFTHDTRINMHDSGIHYRVGDLLWHSKKPPPMLAPQ